MDEQQTPTAQAATRHSAPPRASSPGWWQGGDGRVRPLWRAVMFFVVAGFLAVVSTQGLVRLLDLIWPGTRATLAGSNVPPPGLGAVLYATINAVILLVSWLFLSALDQRSFRTLGISFYPGWAREFLLGAAMGVALMLAVAGTLVAGGWVQYTGWTADASAALPGALGFALFLLLPAAAEEFMLRGYLFQRLLESWGQWGAIVALALVFGLGHLNNPSVTALSTANTVLAGVLLAVAYLKTRALWLPTGLHWAWNAFMGPVLSLPVSGLRAGPPLFEVRLAGPEWLSGGNYGPEGSIVLTVACAGTMVLLWRSRWLTPSPAMQEVLQ